MKSSISVISLIAFFALFVVLLMFLVPANGNEVKPIVPPMPEQQAPPTPPQQTPAFKPLTAMVLAPSAVWLDEYRAENYRDSQIYYNLRFLLSTVRIQQRMIQDLQAEIAILKTDHGPVDEPAITEPADENEVR